MKRGKKQSLASWKKHLAKLSRRMRKKPGHSWRILAQASDRQVHATSTPKLRASLSKTPPSLRKVINAQIFDGSPWAGTVFDELVIDDWLHLEQMDDRYWWMRIGDTVLWITVPRRGPVQVAVRKESE